MSKLLKITTIKNEIVYVPVAKILSMNVHKKGYTEIQGPRTTYQSIETNTPIDALANKLNGLDATVKFLGYIDQSGQKGYVNLAFVAYIKPDKNGNATIECGDDRDSQTLIKTQEPLSALLQRAQSIGIQVVE